MLTEYGIIYEKNKRQEGKTHNRSAMQTRLRRVSWKLIINLYCHSNIIVNLNRRHNFNATFQINVKFSFCFRIIRCLAPPHTTLHSESVRDRQNLCRQRRSKQLQWYHRSTNYFIYFHSLSRSFYESLNLTWFRYNVVCVCFFFRLLVSFFGWFNIYEYNWWKSLKMIRIEMNLKCCCVALVTGNSGTFDCCQSFMSLMDG